MRNRDCAANSNWNLEYQLLEYEYDEYLENRTRTCPALVRYSLNNDESESTKCTRFCFILNEDVYFSVVEM